MTSLDKTRADIAALDALNRQRALTDRETNVLANLIRRERRLMGSLRPHRPVRAVCGAPTAALMIDGRVAGFIPATLVRIKREQLAAKIGELA